MRHLLCATLLCFSNHADAFELSGTIRSNGAPLPQAISIVAERMHGEPQIHGTVENGRYRIDVPEGTLLALVARAPQWEAEPRLIHDAATAGAPDILLYRTAVPEPALAQELLAMEKEDVAARTDWPATGADLQARQRMRETDARNEARLRHIIASKGWPTQTMVGYKAAASAWLIAQHGSDAFLKSSLALMRAAAAQGEITPSRLALAIDRDLTNDKLPQLYGSQFQTGSDGKSVAFPIADPQHLEQRRASVGLAPYAQYRQAFE
ncbi:hypothetical protein VM94_02878 [Janthinobacterium sp. KBS0711]|uniref:DUF6624 domain-containing protein n=1 Tax=Janthinobacterium sp. KBS0711 TaxID=1649647 RepID=UPI0006361E65|nr:DUF6624 domain-containing protein [Janthinobacterium sp. KBS0711]KKO63130.1 hypothetical protein VM94_02878 [Janthinobacterium sp. KBS0711]TSD72873.1 hypothetical protein FFI39_018875 [Janthinobacterium sp. KBS0711]